MSELIVNLPDSEESETGVQDIKDLDLGDVFLDMDGDYCVRFDGGIINIQSDGTLVAYSLEELEEYLDTFGQISPRPELQCTINIEES